MDKKRNDYAQKMLEDSAKFTQLQNEKNEDAESFREQLDKVNEEHQQALNQKKETFKAQMDAS